ncbi:MAG TPA: DUF305 domain-containing protein [Dehalococcoidia bacterium]|nr:DUF305 domain-containing protein [Dehalococcoidia bacterium]
MPRLMSIVGIPLPALVLLIGACTSPQAAPAKSTAPAAASTAAPAASPAASLRAASPAAGSPSAAGTFDRMFIDMMVPHHQGAVEMAKIAETRSQRPEIKQMAADIVRAQNNEIDLMKTWRREWFGSDQTPPLSQMPMVEGITMPGGSTPAAGGMPGMGNMPGMDHGPSAGASGGSTMNMAQDVEALRNAPEPFDQAFIDAMIPHHQSAVAAARVAESRAQRPEIRELAQTIIRDQEREIAQLREWRRAWFGSDRAG